MWAMHSIVQVYVESVGNSAELSIGIHICGISITQPLQNYYHICCYQCVIFANRFNVRGGFYSEKETAIFQPLFHVPILPIFTHIFSLTLVSLI